MAIQLVSRIYTCRFKNKPATIVEIRIMFFTTGRIGMITMIRECLKVIEVLHNAKLTNKVGD